MREVRLLVPDRIAALLPKSSKNRRSAISEVQDRMVQLSREAIAAEKKLRRLHGLVEDGITDLDDVLRTRLTRRIGTGREAHVSVTCIASFGCPTVARLSRDDFTRTSHAAACSGSVSAASKCVIC
jgi:hypothetical protein